MNFISCISCIRSRLKSKWNIVGFHVQLQPKNQKKDQDKVMDVVMSVAGDNKEIVSIATDESFHEKLKLWEKNIKMESLTNHERLIHEYHIAAVKERMENYKDPVTGYEVLTIVAHLRRGSCCGNVCRHCPYFHINVPHVSKGSVHYNSAFYS